MEREENITDGNLTQKEIIQLLLHNAQHMATREEVKSDIRDLKIELKEDISKLELGITQVKSELKEDMSKLETSLKVDISSLKVDNKDLGKRMDRFMFWSLGLTITSTFLILGLIYRSIGLN